MDGRLRSPTRAHALRAPTAGSSRDATICRPHAVVCTRMQTLKEKRGAQRAEALRCQGVAVFGVPADDQGHLCLRSALSELRARYGVRSAMIEGGASMIANCMHAKLAHSVIITIAPKTLVNGLRPTPFASSRTIMPDASDGRGLRDVQTFCLADDVVLCADGPAAQTGETPLPLEKTMANTITKPNCRVGALTPCSLPFSSSPLSSSAKSRL